MKKLLSAGTLALLPFSVFASAPTLPPIASVPEPGTLGLLAVAVGAALYVANRRNKK